MSANIRPSRGLITLAELRKEAEKVFHKVSLPAKLPSFTLAYLKAWWSAHQQIRHEADQDCILRDIRRLRDAPGERLMRRLLEEELVRHERKRKAHAKVTRRFVDTWFSWSIACKVMQALYKSARRWVVFG